jgi:hypothetical protein
MRSLAIVFIFITSLGFSQTEIDSATVRKLNTYQFGGVYKSAVSLNVGGVTGIAGFSYDYFINDHWRFQAGLGFPGVGFGFDYYPWSIQRDKSRFKITHTNALFWGNNTGDLSHYLGLGMTKFFRQRWNLGFDVGGAYVHPHNDIQPIPLYSFNSVQSWFVYPYLNVKLGYRFSFKYMKRKRELERGE